MDLDLLSTMGRVNALKGVCGDLKRILRQRQAERISFEALESLTLLSLKVDLDLRCYLENLGPV